MDVSHILDDLNEAQREAVTAPPGPMLILAGAGSGKTRVLVHRMACLIKVEGVSPFSLLAVTFTNKASKEMRQRVEQLQGVPANGMWVGRYIPWNSAPPVALPLAGCRFTSGFPDSGF